MNTAARARVRDRIARAAPMGVPVLVAFSAVAVGAGLGRALVTTYLPVLLERIRDAPGLIGTVMLVNTVAGFVVPLVVGAWSDRLRARGHGRTLPVVFGGTVLAAGGLLAIAAGHATSYLALAGFAAVAYLGLNAVTTGHRALIPQTFGDEERASATAGEELAMLAGTLLGVVAGGVLVETAGWAPFVFGAALLPLLAIPTVRRMRGREAPLRRPPSQRPDLRGYLRIARRPGVRLVLAAQALWVLGYVGLPPFFVLYAERVLDLRPSSAAFVLAGFGLLVGGAMAAAGAVEPARQRLVLLMGAVAMGAGMFAVSSGHTIVAVAPALVPVAVGFGIVTTLGFPVFSTFIPEGEEGTYSALYFATRSVSSAIALPVAGWTIAATDSYRMLFVLGGAVSLAAALPLLRLGGAAHPELIRAVARRGAAFAGITAALLAAAEYVHRTELLQADEAVLRLFRSFAATPEVVDDLLVNPHLRNYVILVLLAVVLSARRWGTVPPLRAALLVAGAGCVTYAGVRTSWALWERPRPEEMIGLPPAPGHSWAGLPSFPSGHVAVTTALALSMASVVPRLRVVLLSYAALIGWTRLAYGAHFPSDIVAGYLLGWAGATVVLRPLGQPLFKAPRWASQVATRRTARTSGAIAVVTFAVLFVISGAPAAPEGGLLSPSLEQTVHGVLLGVAALCLAAAWRHSAFGAGLVLVGAALGVFAAVQFTPGFGWLVALAFGVPGALFLHEWRRLPTTVLAGFFATVALGGTAAAVMVHDRIYGPTHPESATAAPPDGPVEWLWAGAVTPDGVTVSARLAKDGRARLLVATDARMRDAHVSAARIARAGNGRVVGFRVTGLRPDTAYRYAVEVDGRVDRHRIGRFRTFPEGRASFTFAAGACARVGSNASVFDAIRRLDPRFFVVSGDLFYANIDDPAPGRFVDAYTRMLAEPAPAALYRSVPVAYTWDDHDYGGNTADRTTASRPAVRAVYDAAVPHYALDRRGRSIQQAFTYGRVRFLLLDTRSQRSPADTPDGPRKTMLGARQKAWLERELLAGRDRAALTVVVSSVPWIAKPEPGIDSWGAYPTERAELSRFIARHRIDNLLMVAGDAHMVAIDDGTNSDYSGTGRAGFPVFHAAALDRHGSMKGGPYSEGAHPGAGQFGTVRVDDRGDRVDVELTGRRYDGRTLVRHRFSVEAPER